MAVIPANQWQVADTLNIQGISLLYLLAKHFGNGYTILKEDYEKVVNDPNNNTLTLFMDRDIIKLTVHENSEGLINDIIYEVIPDAETYEEAERTADKV